MRSANSARVSPGRHRLKAEPSRPHGVESIPKLPTAPKSPASSESESDSEPVGRALPSKVRRGAIWSVANTALLRLSGIFITAVVAHILDPRDFGEFAVAVTAYGIVAMVGELGLSACLIRADLDIDRLAPTMVTISVTTSAAQAAAMYAFAEPIASALGSPAAAAPIRVMALVVLIVGVSAVPSAQLMRRFAQNKVFLAEAISFVPSSIALIVLAKSGNGALAFAWSRVIGQAVSGFVVIVSAGKTYRPGLARSALSVLFSFGLLLGVANIVNYIVLNADYALVGHFLGAGPLGRYVLAFNVASWPAALLGNMINNVSMPAFSRVKADPALLRKSIATAMRWVSLIVVPASAMTMALARPLVLTLYGAKWAASAEVLAILAIYGTVSIICVLFANILAGLGRARPLVVIQLVWLAALIPSMVAGVHRDGIVGAAIVHVVVVGPIVLPTYFLVLKRATGVRGLALTRAVLPALLAATAAAVVARSVALQFANPPVQLILGLVAGGLTYAVLVAPLVLALVAGGQPAYGPARRILDVYATVGRRFGLGVRSPTWPAVEGSRHGDAGYQGPADDSVPVADREVRVTGDSAAAFAADQRAALALLVSLSGPVAGTDPLFSTRDRVGDLSRSYGQNFQAAASAPPADRKTIASRRRANHEATRDPP